MHVTLHSINVYNLTTIKAKQIQIVGCTFLTEDFSDNKRIRFAFLPQRHAKGS